jgi:uncharacterized protein (DUF885 family)
MRSAGHRGARVIVTTALLMFPAGCALVNPGPPVPSAADSALARLQLDAALTQYWRAAIDRRYDVALTTGLRITQLPDLSLDGRKADVRLAQRIGSGLDLLDASALSQADYLTALALRWEMDAQAEASAFHWVDFGFLAPPTAAARQLLELFRMFPLATTGDADAFLFFAEAFPFVLERTRAGLSERLARGYAAPREMVASTIAFHERLLALGADGPWRASPERTAALDTVDQRAFSAELSSGVELRVVPALDSFVAWLRREYLPQASRTPGLWQYPGGKELYRHLLRRHTSLDVPPEEAHRVGLGELRRIDSTLASIRARQRWNPGAAAFHDSLRLAMGPPAPLDTIIAAIGAHGRRISPRLVGTFAQVPTRDAIVRAATPSESLLWPDGVYRPASTADSIGTLLLTDRWGTAAWRATLASRTYRLLLPGRHLEAALTLGNPAVPPLRRFTSSPGFSDGWGQYAASLAGELGMYEDPLQAYGRLLDEGEATALLVIDTGIHYLGWSTAQARTVLGRYVLAPAATIDSLIVERVINGPGRAGAGALGLREVAAMRAWMQREQGRDFSLERWHGEMLSLGSLPLPIVGSHMEWWLYDAERRRRDAARAAALKAAQEAEARTRTERARPGAKPARDTSRAPPLGDTGR